MQGGDDSRAELVIDPPLEQQRDALLDRRGIHLLQPAGQRVAGDVVLHVHCGVVYEPAVYERAKPLRMSAVGVELNGKAKLLYARDELGKPAAQQRLAPREGHAVKQAPAGIEKLHEPRVVRHGGGGAPKLAVVAEGAAQVAPGQKHRAGGSARKIEQRELLQAVDIHCSVLSLRLSSSLIISSDRKLSSPTLFLNKSLDEYIFFGYNELLMQPQRVNDLFIFFYLTAAPAGAIILILVNGVNP